MEILKTAIEGLLIIKPRIFSDERGYFFESYNENIFSAEVGKWNFVQDNESKSQKNVLRGLHFQKPPYEQGKLVRVTKGSVLDIAVDIRKNSPTFGEHIAIELNEENKLQFFIPPGFAHGFITLEDNTIFTYKCTGFYNQQSEGILKWNDPDLKIDWKIDNPIISQKDQHGESLKNLNSPF